MKVGESASFFSESKNKKITGTILKVNNRTVILEVQRERTIFKIVKSFFGKTKEKEDTVTEIRYVKKRLSQLVA